MGPIERNFMYYTEQEIRKLIPDGLKIEAIERYTEIEQDDSLLVILKGGSET